MNLKKHTFNLIAVSLCAASSFAAELAIPTIDISQEKDRHVIIAEGTAEIYQGHADALLMPDEKTMFCVYTLNHGWGEPQMKRSDDAGVTWRSVPIPENWNEWNDKTSKPHSTLGGKGKGWLPMIHRLVDAQGVERLFIWDRGKDNRMIQSMSLDGGETWSPMMQTNLRGIEPSMNIIASEGGRKHLMWNSDWSPSIQQAVSYDGGLT